MLRRFFYGDLGWAESYIDKNWETTNLTGFLEWGAKNFINSLAL